MPMSTINPDPNIIPNTSFYGSNNGNSLNNSYQVMYGQNSTNPSTYLHSLNIENNLPDYPTNYQPTYQTISQSPQYYSNVPLKSSNLNNINNVNSINSINNINNSLNNSLNNNSNINLNQSSSTLSSPPLTSNNSTNTSSSQSTMMNPGINMGMGMNMNTNYNQTFYQNTNSNSNSNFNSIQILSSSNPNLPLNPTNQIQNPIKKISYIQPSNNELQSNQHIEQNIPSSKLSSTTSFSSPNSNIEDSSSNSNKVYDFENHQNEVSSVGYIPSDNSVDISNFTEEDIIILKNLLPLSEVHKWKYVSNKLSKHRSKKLNAEYCIKKFHEMYNLPFNPKNSLLHSNYFLKLNKTPSQLEENYEGMVGSSIPYIVSKYGWNYID